ncbi:hypothetical protein ACHAPJ_013145 [Fusarium lateritium]
MSDPMDTTTPSDPIGSASATAPTKPSLRILDGGSAGLNTREDDLAHGPSLLGLGGGHEYAQGPPDSHLTLDLELEDLDHPDPGTTMMSPISLELPTPMPPQTMSLSEVSQSGASLSVPADTLSSTGISYTGEQMRLPATQDEVPPLFSWKYEFSWEDSCLCFDGKPLELVKTHEDGHSKANPGSEIPSSKSLATLPRSQSPPFPGDEFMLFGLAGIGSFHDSAEHWDPNELSQDLEVASTACSISSGGFTPDTVTWDGLITQASDSELSIEMDKRLDWIVELLVDDYYRSYAPQKSQRCRGAAQNKNMNHAPGDSGTKARRSGKSAASRRGSGRRKAASSGGESEDGDNRGDRQHSSGSRKSKNSRRFACPFLKLMPQKHGTRCTLKFMTISHVKDHIRRKHRDTIYCPKCHMVFAEGQILPHTCVYFGTPDGLITKERLEAINNRVDRSQSHEEQWQQIYRVIFPNQTPCFSPYLNNAEEEKLRHAEEYLRSGSAQMILHEEMKDWGFDAESRAKFSRLLYHRYYPRLWLNYAPNGEVNPCIVGDNDQTHSLTQPSQTVDPREINMLIPYDTARSELQHVPNISTMIQSNQILTLAEHSDPMSELSPTFENATSSSILNANGIGDFLGTTEYERLEFPENDAPGALDDDHVPYLDWLEGHKTHEMDLDFPWNIEGLIQD